MPWQSTVGWIARVATVVCFFIAIASDESLMWWVLCMGSVVVALTARDDAKKVADGEAAKQIRRLVEDCLARGVLPVAKCDLMLEREEQSHFKAVGTWCEMRAAKGGSCQGLSFSVPIVRGVRYTVGSYRNDTRRELTDIDKGILYVTNRRLLFNGSQRNVEVDLRKLVQLRVSQEALALERNAGEHVAFRTSDPETLAMVVTAVWERR